jgi:hypothetical protein
MGKPIQAKWHFQTITRRGRQFKNFFTNNHYYVAKFIDQYDDDKHISFAGIFKNIMADDLSIFLKMDIEHGEYRCLHQIEPYMNKLNGMVIEFHSLDICEERFEKIMQVLLKTFYVIHIHGNNKAELVHGTNMPNTLEITLINKNLITGDIMLSNKKYPLKNLDYPCNPTKEDIALNFS